jgi:hypothetical protein
MVLRWLPWLLLIALRVPAQPSVAATPTDAASPSAIALSEMPVAESTGNDPFDDGTRDHDGDDDDDDDDVALPNGVVAPAPRVADASLATHVTPLCGRAACSRLFRPPRSA